MSRSLLRRERVEDGHDANVPRDEVVAQCLCRAVREAVGDDGDGHATAKLYDSSGRVGGKRSSASSTKFCKASARPRRGT